MNRKLGRLVLEVILIAASFVLMPIASLAATNATCVDQVWTGTIETAGFWGSMELKLIHQGDVWEGKYNFDVGGSHLSNTVRDLRIHA